MELASLTYFIWIVLFLIISWTSKPKYTPYLYIVFGVSFVISKVPLAGGILILEALLCYYVSKKQKQHNWWLVIFTIVVIFTAFLMVKYYSTKFSFIFPLGISYFTFRLIHYVQENYRQRLRKHSLIEFLTYVTFLPTYLVGPINLFPAFLTNLRRRKWDSNQFSLGIERTLYGYAQLIIIGNFVVNYLIKNWIAVHPITENNFLQMCINSAHMWLDLYIRFSAYSSIAIGISAMAGFNIIENFNYPFFASNIRDFWQRWHISLTGWCREYIFAPLAAITRKPFIAIGVTMITIGVWHELSFRYILWGLYHTIGIIFYEKYAGISKGIQSEKKWLISIQKGFGTSFTIIFVVMSFPITSLLNDLIMEVF